MMAFPVGRGGAVYRDADREGRRSRDALESGQLRVDRSKLNEKLNERAVRGEGGAMVAIEEVRFRVLPEARERLVQIDEEIWTAMLRSRPGYLSKEVWLDK